MRTFWIFTVHFSIRNNAFHSELLLPGRMFSIRIFFIFSETLLNVNNSCFFHVRLRHINLLKDMLKQPLAFNATVLEFKIVTLFISIIFLTFSVGLQLSLLFLNINLPFWIIESSTWIETFSYPDRSLKLTAWLGLLIILFDIESNNEQPDILPNTFFPIELCPSE